MCFIHTRNFAHDSFMVSLVIEYTLTGDLWLSVAAQLLDSTLDRCHWNLTPIPQFYKWHSLCIQIHTLSWLKCNPYIFRAGVMIGNFLPEFVLWQPLLPLPAEDIGVWGWEAVKSPSMVNAIVPIAAALPDWGETIECWAIEYSGLAKAALKLVAADGIVKVGKCPEYGLNPPGIKWPRLGCPGPNGDSSMRSIVGGLRRAGCGLGLQ